MYILFNVYNLRPTTNYLILYMTWLILHFKLIFFALYNWILNYFNFYCKRYGIPQSAHLYCMLYMFCILGIYELEIKHSKQFRASKTWEISLVTLTIITNAWKRELWWAIRPTVQIDNWLTAASYQETASCRYTARRYAQWLPAVQNCGHSLWERKEH